VLHTYFGTPADSDGVGAMLIGTGTASGLISIEQPAVKAAAARTEAARTV